MGDPSEKSQIIKSVLDLVCYIMRTSLDTLWKGIPMIINIYVPLYWGFHVFSLLSKPFWDVCTFVVSLGSGIMWGMHSSHHMISILFEGHISGVRGHFTCSFLNTVLIRNRKRRAWIEKATRKNALFHMLRYLKENISLFWYLDICKSFACSVSFW